MDRRVYAVMQKLREQELPPPRQFTSHNPQTRLSNKTKKIN